MAESRFTVSAGERAAVEARQELDRLIGGYPPDLRADARLCLTEVVANAVEHAGLSLDDEIVVALTTAAHRLRLDVCYPGSGFVAKPKSRRSVWGDEKGRGLTLVDALALSWGASPDTGHVWVELVEGGGTAAT